MGDFETDMAFTLARETRPGHEDEVTNYKWDPGGVTKFGISKTRHPNVDVANLTLAQAEDIYRREYWLAAGCDVLPDPMALNVFDASVNLGVPAGHALIAAPRLALLPTVDAYLWARVARYVAIVEKDPKAAVSLPGWIKRCLLVRQASAS